MSPDFECLYWRGAMGQNVGTGERRMTKHGFRRSVRIGAAVVGPLALALAVSMAAVSSASAQQPFPAPMPGAGPQGASPCAQFGPLNVTAREKGQAIGAAQKRHADRKEMCSLVSTFAVAEGAVIKFLETNQTWCGVPADAIKMAKANHEKTLKFRDLACAPAAQPKIPTLSDAIGTPKLDTGKNTKTGHGTFDTLTGNPLAQ
jgi:hypothetical protein